jgi:hypothetical protein
MAHNSCVVAAGTARPVIEAHRVGPDPQPTLAPIQQGPDAITGQPFFSSSAIMTMMPLGPRT